MSLIYADMHNHTTFSDGRLTPTELIDRLSKLGAKACAITDHDSVDGVEEGREEAKKKNLLFSPAIEISTYTYREIHILGYRLDIFNKDFLETLLAIKTFRINRNIALYNRLKELDINLDLNSEESGIGRVHFARAMVEQKYSSSINEAFDVYLGNGKKAYVESKRISPLEAVKAIKACGGVPVLAHPKAYIQDRKLDLIVSGLIRYGLEGIESKYPTHNETDTKNISALTKKYRLIPTSGSDFHVEGGIHLEEKTFTPLMEEYDVQKLLLK